MQSFKVAVFNVVLISALLALSGASYASGSHDLTIGNRINGDYLLEQKEVNKGSVPLWVAEKSVTIKGDGRARITSVEIYDLKPGGHSATPTILKGGPGESFVTLNFESQRGHGIHFLVKVYAK